MKPILLTLLCCATAVCLVLIHEHYADERNSALCVSIRSMVGFGR